MSGTSEPDYTVLKKLIDGYVLDPTRHRKDGVWIPEELDRALAHAELRGWVRTSVAHIYAASNQYAPSDQQPPPWVHLEMAELILGKKRVPKDLRIGGGCLVPTEALFNLWAHRINYDPAKEFVKHGKVGRPPAKPDSPAWPWMSDGGAPLVGVLPPDDLIRAGIPIPAADGYLPHGSNGNLYREHVEALTRALARGWGPYTTKPGWALGRWVGDVIAHECLTDHAARLPVTYGPPGSIRANTSMHSGSGPPPGPDYANWKRGPIPVLRHGEEIDWESVGWVHTGTGEYSYGIHPPEPGQPPRPAPSPSGAPAPEPEPEPEYDPYELDPEARPR